MQALLATSIVRPDDHYPEVTPEFDLPKFEGLDDGVRFHRVGEIAIELRRAMLKAHTEYLLILAGIINREIEAAMLVTGESELETANSQMAAISRLINDKQAELNRANEVVQRYFAFDPVTATDKQMFRDFVGRAGTRLTPQALKALTAALQAAYEARALSQAIAMLQERAGSVATTLLMLQAREAEQLAAQQAEAARLAAEAATAAAERLALQAAAAEAARIAAEAELARHANTFSMSGAASIAGPLIITPAGRVISTALSFAARAAIGTALGLLGGLTIGVGIGFVVGVSALLYASRLGKDELPERYALQTPLADLDPQLASTLASQGSTVAHAELPYRFSSRATSAGDSELFIVKTNNQIVPAQVRVLAATHDAQRDIYSITTADFPPRTLTWTPVTQPTDASTTLPAERPEPPIYEGAKLTPVELRIDSYPGVADASLDDYVIVFPADSGLPPLYVMFRDRREEPGTGSGDGVEVGESWSKYVETLEGAPIPVQVATLLKGLSFRNWTAYREALWKAVANDPFLSAQFDPRNIGRMKRGRAPAARAQEWVGDLISLQIHHKLPIAQGGDVYNSENLTIVTPKQHHTIHYGN